MAYDKNQGLTYTLMVEIVHKQECLILPFTTPFYAFSAQNTRRLQKNTCGV
jgi:hypothetical protein